MMISPLMCQPARIPAFATRFQGDKPAPDSETSPPAEPTAPQSPPKSPSGWVKLLKGRMIYIAAGLPLTAVGLWLDSTRGAKIMTDVGMVLTAMGFFRNCWSVTLETKKHKVDLTPDK